MLAWVHQGAKCDLLLSQFLENLDFDQKYLWKLTVEIFKIWHRGKEQTEISVLIERKNYKKQTEWMEKSPTLSFLWNILTFTVKILRKVHVQVFLILRWLIKTLATLP